MFWFNVYFTDKACGETFGIQILANNKALELRAFYVLHPNLDGCAWTE